MNDYNMTLRAAAEWFKVHPETVRRWALKHRLPHVKRGGRSSPMLFSRADLADWQKSRRPTQQSTLEMTEQ